MRNIKNIFEYKEFNNIKTVHQAVTNPAKKVNQLSLLMTYESLQKLGRLKLLLGNSNTTTN